MTTMTSTLNRRAILCGATTIPALTIAGVAVGKDFRPLSTDPIFAAIERHRTSIAEYLSVLNDPSQLEEQWLAAGARMNAAGYSLLDAQPTTFAGVAALLTHVGHEHGNLPDGLLLAIIKSATSVLASMTDHGG